MLDALRMSAACTMVCIKGVRGSEVTGPGGRSVGSTECGKVGGEVIEARMSSIWGRYRRLLGERNRLEVRLPLREERLRDVEDAVDK